MELPGEVYLFNLSLIAITFTAVSAVTMLLRQTMGGKLSNFDIYLLTSYISLGFVLAAIAILPALISLFELASPLQWALASGSAAVVLIIKIIQLRKVVSPGKWPLVVNLAFAGHGLAILGYLFNAFATDWQGSHLFALSVTISVFDVMRSFVRRIASLLGEKPGDDWDPKRG